MLVEVRVIVLLMLLLNVQQPFRSDAANFARTGKGDQIKLRGFEDQDKIEGTSCSSLSMATDERGAIERQLPCLIGTLGMFIIDQFRFEDEQTGEDLGDRGLGHQIGGGGTYFAIGARMWLPPKDVLMVVDQGDDLTEEEHSKMRMYAPESSNKQQHNLWRYRTRSDGHGTTRAVNVYRGEERGFAYLTPKMRLEPHDLLCETMPRLPRYIHCICSPSRAKEICAQIDSLNRHWFQDKRPKIIWEPIPDSAIPENLDACLSVLDHIDVISPNHEEAAKFLSVAKEQMFGMNARTSITKMVLDRFYTEAALVSVQKVPLVCIRCGALGAVISSSREEAPIWVDAYHTPADVDKVVDVTGAGNSWLGGFAAGLALGEERQQQQPVQHRTKCSWTSESIKTAAQMASVSASLVVEQQSLPILQTHPDKSDLWNGEEIYARLRRLQSRGE